LFPSLAAFQSRAKALRASSARLNVWRGQEAAAFVSPRYEVDPFNRAVLSWNTTGDALFELEVDGRWHIMGQWSAEPRSVKTGDVDVDTLVLKVPARSFRFRVTPQKGAMVTLVAIAHWTQGEKNSLTNAPSAAWGKTLSVPLRSQSEGGIETARICSPTALSMVLESYGINKPTKEVALGVYDRAEKIYGNWPFNTAYAHQVSGLESYIQRFMGLEDLEREIAEGRPVIISVKWRDGDLDNAPIAKTDGHVLVVVGFTAEGDVIVNDPAARSGGVRRVYKREQVYKIWLERASGVAYILSSSGVEWSLVSGIHVRGVFKRSGCSGHPFPPSWQCNAAAYGAQKSTACAGLIS